MMWANINHCPKKHSGHGSPSSGQESHTGSTSKLIPSNSFSNLHTINEEHHGHSNDFHRSTSAASDHCNTTVDHDSTQYRTSNVIYADCQSASRGLFGIVFLKKLIFGISDIFFNLQLE